MNQKKSEKLQSFSERFENKVKVVLKEEVNKISYEVWIEPLEVIEFTGNVLLLFHDYDPVWVQQHYGARIKELVNEGTKKEITVKITNADECRRR